MTISGQSWRRHPTFWPETLKYWWVKCIFELHAIFGGLVKIPRTNKNSPHDNADRWNASFGSLWYFGAFEVNRIDQFTAVSAKSALVTFNVGVSEELSPYLA